MIQAPRIHVISCVARNLVLAAAAVCGLTASANAQPLTEGFDTVTGGVPNASWATQNNSDSPDQPYFQGNPAVFTAHSGATNSYIGVNFQSTSGLTGTETISNWLITPMLTGMNNGDTVTFFARTVDTPSFPDRLQLRLSLSGASTNVGTLPTDVGDFTTLLVDINPTLTTSGFPNVWTQFTATLSGLSGPTDGRMAFRYFVTDGGPNGNNSDYIGIDDFAYTPSAVPEPGTLALVGVAAIGGLRLRRRAAAAAA